MSSRHRRFSPVHKNARQSIFRRWLARTRIPKAAVSDTHPFNIVLYSKPACHLCAQARETLAAINEVVPLSVSEIDITQDIDLINDFDERVPVVMADQTELAAGNIDANQLWDRLLNHIEARP